MHPLRKAVIDVGTNSVKVLVAEMGPDEIHPLREESSQTRLGRGLYQDHRLRRGAIEQTAEAVAAFVHTARSLGAASIRIIATSAARDAVNSAELVRAIEESSGSAVEIISGEQEALWTSRGVLTDRRLHDERIVIMDLGGGSAEFILAAVNHPELHQSFPLGTVRLLEKFGHSNPPKDEERRRCLDFARDFLRREVAPWFAKAQAQSGRPAPHLLVGAGGTAAIMGRMKSKLADFDRNRIEGQRLSLEGIRQQVDSLWKLTWEERQSVPGLPGNRADVILTGVVIYQAVMEELALPELQISTRGIRWAALLD